MRQFVLSDLARSVGQSKGQTNETSVKNAIDYIYSKVETRDIPEGQEETPPRVFMVRSLLVFLYPSHSYTFNTVHFSRSMQYRFRRIGT